MQPQDIFDIFDHAGAPLILVGVGQGAQLVDRLAREMRGRPEVLRRIAAVYLIVTAPCSGLWVVFGAAMRRVLADERRARWFNGAMAALLVASIIPTLAD